MLVVIYSSHCYLIENIHCPLYNHVQNEACVAYKSQKFTSLQKHYTKVLCFLCLQACLICVRRCVCLYLLCKKASNMFFFHLV